MTRLETFFLHYVMAALWSSTDDGDTHLDANYGEDDLAPETRAAWMADCAAFMKEADEIEHGMPDEQIAHDFWLTRCGHGCGFWDGDYPEPAGEQLTAIAQRYGEVWPHVGDDGRIYS